MAKDDGKSSLNSTTKVKKKRITIFFCVTGHRAQNNFSAVAGHVDRPNQF